MRSCLLPVVLLAILYISSLPAGADNAKAGSRLSSADLQTIRDSADYILRCQLANGLIAVNPENAISAIPYSSNLACTGLLRAYQITGEDRYLKSLLHYADWYVTHMNPDGTSYDWKGTREQPVSTGNYDSSDAYPATFIVLCYETYRVTHDRAWLLAKYPAIVNCMKGITLTWQNDGLTFAKPDYKVKYLMDNLEVRLGLRAAVNIAEALHTPAVRSWKALLEQNRLGLKKLWLQKEGWFSAALFEDGNLDRNFAVWYPDGMANAMALGYITGNQDPKAREVASLVKDKFTDTHDYWRFMALWKFGCKDEALKVRAKMGARITESVDKGLYIRTFVPEMDDFFLSADCLLLPELMPISR